MKKRFTKVLALLLAASLLAACGDDYSEAPVAGNTAEEGDVAMATGFSDHTDTQASESSDATPVNHDAEYELINAFIDNSEEVSVSGFDLIDDGKYTFVDLIAAYGTKLTGAYGIGYAAETGNACITDIGNDGSPELLYKVKYMDLGSSNIPVEEIFVFKPVNGEMVLKNILTTYYRTYSTINKYGYVEEGGSNSASSVTANAGCIDANGDYRRLYNCDAYIGLPTAKLPTEALYGTGLTDILCDSPATVAGPYSVYVFNFDPDRFADFVGSAESDQTAYFTEKAKASAYWFTDADGNDVEVDEDYVSLCAENDIFIVNSDYVNEMISSAYISAGLTEDMTDINDISWDESSEDGFFVLVKDASDLLKHIVYSDGKIELESEFLDNNAEALEGGSYTIRDFGAALTTYMASTSDMVILDGISYAFGDDGKDGFTELLLDYRFSNPGDPTQFVDLGIICSYSMVEDAYNVIAIYGYYSDDTLTLLGSKWEKVPGPEVVFGENLFYLDY